MPRRPKILVVEDYASTRDLIEQALTGSFIETTCVCDGREALACLAVEKPDLVLSDVIMPNVDGLALARQIRSQARLADLPVVFLTGADSSMLRRQMAELGARAVLEKPFDCDNLVRQLRGFLAEVRARTDEPLYGPGWFYAPLGTPSVLSCFAVEHPVDRIVLPVHPRELAPRPIIKATPVQAASVGIRLPEPVIQIAPAPSSWTHLPAGAPIPAFAAVGRTSLVLPEEIATPSIPRRLWTARPERPARKTWIERLVGSATCGLFEAERTELGFGGPDADADGLGSGDLGFSVDQALAGLAAA